MTSLANQIKIAAIGIIGGIAAIGLFGALVNLGESTKTATVRSGSTPVESLEVPHAFDTAPVGESRNITVAGDRELKVLSSQELSQIESGNPYVKPVTAEGGKLVAVSIEITNTGNESGSTYWTQLKLKDKQGRIYSQIADFEEIVTINMWLGDQGVLSPGDQLFPGQRAQNIIVFRVAPDAEQPILLANDVGFQIN